MRLTDDLIFRIMYYYYFFIFMTNVTFLMNFVNYVCLTDEFRFIFIVYYY